MQSGKPRSGNEEVSQASPDLRNPTALFPDLKGKKRIDALIDLAWQSRGKNVRDALATLAHAEALLDERYPDHNRARASILAKRGFLLYLSGRAKDGLLPALEGFELFVRLKNKSDIAHTCTTIGILYLELGQTEEANKFLKEAYSLYTELKFQPGIGVALANMGLLAAKGEHNEDAAKYYSRALEVMRESGNLLGASTMLNNLGTIAYKDKRFREALSLLRQSLNINHRLGNHTYVALILGNICCCYVDVNQPDRAWKLLDMADASYRRGGVPELPPSLEIARIRVLGEKSSKHYDIIEAIRRAEGLRQKTTDKESILELMELIPELYTKAGQLHDAIRHYKAFIEFKKKAAIAEANLRADYAEVVANIAHAREREKAERRQRVELAKVNRKLQELNGRKDDFLRMIAHDLKTSAVVVQALSKMNLSQPGDGDAARAQDDRLTLMASNHILQLIENLKDIDAIESDALSRPFEWIDPNSLLVQWMRQYRLEARIKGITLLKDLDPTLPLVESNPLSLSRIIDNLLSNAIKFSPPDSTITLSSQTEGRMISLAVRDQGPGVPDGEQKLLFKKFSRLSPKPTMGEASTGLGLYTAKKLSASLGAALTYQNHPEGGAVFRLSFPSEPTAAPTSSP